MGVPLPPGRTERTERTEREEGRPRRRKEAEDHRKKHEAFLLRLSQGSKYTRADVVDAADGAALIQRRRISNAWKPRFYVPPPGQDPTSVFQAMERRVAEYARGERQSMPGGLKLLQRLANETGVMYPELARNHLVPVRKVEKQADGGYNRPKQVKFKPDPAVLDAIHATIQGVLDGSYLATDANMPQEVSFTDLARALEDTTARAGTTDDGEQRGRREQMGR